MMIKYVLHEGVIVDNDAKTQTLITAAELAKNYGLRRGGCKVMKYGILNDEVKNTDDVAYIHLHPQFEHTSYDKIKKNLINV
jgi:hypothetical protein